MKRIYLLLIIFILTALQLNAAFQADQTRAISLQAAAKAVAELYIEPISAQTTSYRFGMPFDIQDISVSPNAADGRPIAHWSVLSNSNFKIRITKMEKLHHVDKTEADGFDYTLTFTYDLSYFVGTEQRQLKGSESISTFESEKTINMVPTDINPGSYIGSVDGTIYFKFVSINGNEDEIKNSIDTAEAGEYQAAVEFTVEAIE